MNNSKVKKAFSAETFVFLFIFIGIFYLLAKEMSLSILIKVLMSTAHSLLIDTVFFIMAIAVLAGAVSALLSEFGVIAFINKFISIVMKPLYGLPGAASIGAITTYLSDNPAILTLAKDEGFKKYFKNYQIPVLCNLGTAFGMGLVLTVFMVSLDKSFYKAAIIGNIGAIVGSIVSVRIMMIFTKKYYNVSKKDILSQKKEDKTYLNFREIREGNPMDRALDAILTGGKNGVDLGLSIIPGVLIICTFIMILTNSPSEVKDGIAIYKGVAYEGVAFLPKVGSYLAPIFQFLFGFKSPEAIAFPITSLGAVGAAMSLVPRFLEQNLISANDIAVFTAMGMCFSGYLSTHVSMMDALNERQLVNKAILSHTIGGLFAGISAHYIYLLIELI